MGSNSFPSQAAPRRIEPAVVAAQGIASRSLATARALFPEGLSAISRAARCYLLMQRGSIDLPLAPRVAEAITIHPRQTIEMAAGEALRECLDQIATNFVVVERLDDPEGTHQLRKGLRRLRTVFSAYVPVLDGAKVALLRNELRQLYRKAGKSRDLDVARSIVWQEAEANPDEPGLSVLAERLSRRAARPRKELRSSLTGPKGRTFLLDVSRLVDEVEQLALIAPSQDRRPDAVHELANSAIGGCWSALSKRSQEFDELDAFQRHEIRKALRKLHYTVGLFQSLYPASRVEPFLRRLRACQKALGDMHDFSVLTDTLRGPQAPGDPAQQCAVAWMIDAGSARSKQHWIEAKALWLDISRTEPFWET